MLHWLLAVVSYGLCCAAKHTCNVSSHVMHMHALLMSQALLCTPMPTYVARLQICQLMSSAYHLLTWTIGLHGHVQGAEVGLSPLQAPSRPPTEQTAC